MEIIGCLRAVTWAYFYGWKARACPSKQAGQCSRISRTAAAVHLRSQPEHSGMWCHGNSQRSQSEQMEWHLVQFVTLQQNLMQYVSVWQKILTVIFWDIGFYIPLLLHVGVRVCVLCCFFNCVPQSRHTSEMKMSCNDSMAGRVLESHKPGK